MPYSVSCLVRSDVELTGLTLPPFDLYLHKRSATGPFRAEREDVEPSSLQPHKHIYCG